MPHVSGAVGNWNAFLLQAFCIVFQSFKEKFSASEVRAPATEDMECLSALPSSVSGRISHFQPTS